MPDKVVEIPGVGNIAFPDSMSEAEINAASAKLYKEKQGALGVSMEPPDHPMLDKAKEWAQSVMDMAKQGGQLVVDHPATAGALGLGTLASLATGGMAAPAAMGLVGLAGAGGAGAGLAASQVANRDTQPAPTIGGNAKSMAWEGAQMGAGEGLGRGLVAGAKVAGRAVMDSALSASSRLAREYPELSQIVIDHALTISKGGAAKARDLLNAAKSVANAALSKADAAGAKVPITAATDGLDTLFEHVSNSPNPFGNFNRLAAIEKQITGGRSDMLTMAQADALKRQLQLDARNLYRAIERMPTEGAPRMDLIAKAKAAMAASLNEAIANISTQAGAPGYRTANGLAQQLIGANRGIQAQLNPGNNLVRALQVLAHRGAGSGLGAAVGEYYGGAKGAAVGGVAGTVLSSPKNLSRLAIALSNPSVQAIVRQLPKPVVEAIASLFDGPTPGQPSAGLPTK